MAFGFLLKLVASAHKGGDGAVCIAGAEYKVVAHNPLRFRHEMS